MSYKQLNVNPLGRVDSDCFIRALSCATSSSWDSVYERISDIAQSQGAMMNDGRFVLDYLDRRYERVKPAITVGQTSKKYRHNIVLITMKGHITCSKYGVIYDSFDPSNRKAEYCWIVK